MGSIWFVDVDYARAAMVEEESVKSGDVVESWVDKTYRIHRRSRHPNVAGLDVEWRPAREPGPVAVLQVCVGRRCLVFQILRADYVPDALSCFLADRRFVFVGVGVRDDAARLRDGYGLEVSRAVDLARLAARTLGRPELRCAARGCGRWCGR